MADYVPTFLGSVMKQIACTPNKNFDNDAYEKGVIEPAAKIRKLQEKLGDERPSERQMREVMALLLIIFETKMVDMEEREDRVRETLDRTQCQDVFPDLLPLKSDLESQITQLGLEPGADFLAELESESEAGHAVAGDSGPSGETLESAPAGESGGASDMEDGSSEAATTDDEAGAQAAVGTVESEAAEGSPGDEADNIKSAGELSAGNSSEDEPVAQAQPETAGSEADPAEAESERSAES